MSMSPYFPMFIDLEGKEVLVIGGGKIAARRIAVLLHFGCSIKVIAKERNELLNEFERSHLIDAEYRKYQKGDCKDVYCVLAATDSREVNHAIAAECRENNIIVNVCDCREECDFYFPAVIQKEHLVIGVTASGTDHKRAKKIADRIRELSEDIFSDYEA